MKKATVRAASMAARESEREKKKAGIDAAAASVPLDVVSIILLRATPCTLWSSRLVCKHWYSLITSPEFVAHRRSATGGSWLATLHVMRRNARAGTNTSVVRSAWILIYNPLLNIQEKVSVPIYQLWPNAKTLLLYHLHIHTSDDKNCLTLQAQFARSTLRGTWNPIVGSIQPGGRHYSMYPTNFPAPQDVEGPGWRRRYSRSHGGVMAISVSSLKIFRSSSGGWEFMGAMPDDMRQIMGEDDLRFVATPNYYLIWNRHTQGPEKVALFQPMKGIWTWVDNIWHSNSHLCRWNEVDPVVISCF